MNLRIDLSVSDTVAIPIDVGGWPDYARRDLRDRLATAPVVISSASHADEIILTVKRDGLDISALKQLVRATADDLLPGKDLLYRY